VDGGTDAGALPGTNNPVLPGLYADPHVAEFDGVFYIYPTTDGYANWGATSFSVFSSTNLVDWTDRGVILDLAKDLTWATQSAWAPGIARAGSTYYLYFCAAQQIGVATSASPTGRSRTRWDIRSSPPGSSAPNRSIPIPSSTTTEPATCTSAAAPVACGS